MNDIQRLESRRDVPSDEHTNFYVGSVGNLVHYSLQVFPLSRYLRCGDVMVCRCEALLSIRIAYFDRRVFTVDILNL